MWQSRYVGPSGLPLSWPLSWPLSRLLARLFISRFSPFLPFSLMAGQWQALAFQSTQTVYWNIPPAMTAVPQLECLVSPTVPQGRSGAYPGLIKDLKSTLESFRRNLIEYWSKWGWHTQLHIQIKTEMFVVESRNIPVSTNSQTLTLTCDCCFPLLFYIWLHTSPKISSLIEFLSNKDFLPRNVFLL